MTASAGPLESVPRRRPRWWTAARWALVGLAVVALAPVLRRQWHAYVTAAGGLRPDWLLATASAALVLATYALLVQAWRALVTSWGGRLRFLTAARIWSVSNLGRYVPGKVWSIGVMGALAREAGVSPVAATGSALVGTLVNLAAGALIAVATGASMIGDGSGRARAAAVGLAIVGTGACLALPWVLPWGVRVAARMVGRDVAPPPHAPGTYVGVVAANACAWCTYGLAFQLLARSLLPRFAGTWSDAVAVFTISYLAGYMALFSPGGLVAREGVMIAVLARTGLTSVADATVLAVGSRLWLTALELAPGLLFLLAGRRPRPDAAAASHPLDASTR